MKVDYHFTTGNLLLVYRKMGTVLARSHLDQNYLVRTAPSKHYIKPRRLSGNHSGLAGKGYDSLSAGCV